MHYAQLNSSTKSTTSVNETKSKLDASGPAIWILADYALPEPKLTFGLSILKGMLSGKGKSTTTATTPSGNSDINYKLDMEADQLAPHVFFMPHENFYAGLLYEVDYTKVKLKFDSSDIVGAYTYSAPRFRIGTRFGSIYDLSLSYRLKSDRSSDENPTRIQASEWLLAVRWDATEDLQGKFLLKKENTSERNQKNVEDHSDYYELTVGGLARVTPEITVGTDLQYKPAAEKPKKADYEEHYTTWGIEPSVHYSIDPLSTVSGSVTYTQTSGSTTTTPTTRESKNKQDNSTFNIGLAYTRHI